MVQCSQCLSEKSLAEFSFKRGKPVSRCKSCIAENVRALRGTSPGTLRCCKCRKTKPYKDFDLEAQPPKRKICKQCPPPIPRIPKVEPLTRKCRICELHKPLEAFAFVPGKNFLRQSCEACKTYRMGKSKQLWRSEASKARALQRMSEQRKSNRAYTVFKDSQRSDRRRGRENDLTLEQVAALIALPCFYCEDSSLRRTLDRIDNSIGHISTNVVTACVRCNYFRRDVPYKAWIYLRPYIKEAVAMGLFGDWTGEIWKTR